MLLTFREMEPDFVPQSEFGLVLFHRLIIINHMMERSNRITVFTKPWKERGIEELAELVAKLGFDGVELAVRPGFQIEPETALTSLPVAAKTFAAAGLRIESVATELTAELVEACARAEVPILRTMLPVDPESGYRESVRRFQDQCRSLIPALEKTSVQIGVQNHCDHFVGTAHGLITALEPLPEQFVAILDLAHTTLCGEPIPYALELAAPRLAMVNLKNAVMEPGPVNEAGELTWRRRWVAATEGLTSWSQAVAEIRTAGFVGPICLTAEYKDPAGQSVTEDAAIPLIRSDLAHLKHLLILAN